MGEKSVLGYKNSTQCVVLLAPRKIPAEVAAGVCGMNLGNRCGFRGAAGEAGRGAEGKGLPRFEPGKKTILCLGKEAKWANFGYFPRQRVVQPQPSPGRHGGSRWFCCFSWLLLFFKPANKTSTQGLLPPCIFFPLSHRAPFPGNATAASPFKNKKGRHRNICGLFIFFFPHSEFYLLA